MIARTMSSNNSQANETDPVFGPEKPECYINQYGRQIVITSPLITSEAPLEIREAWKVHYLDLEAGEVSQLDDVSNSWCYCDTYEEAVAYVENNLDPKIRWSALITHVRVDQYERDTPIVPSPRTEKRQRRIARINVPFEKLQVAHEVGLSVLGAQMTGGDGFRKQAAAFVVREIERTMMQLKTDPDLQFEPLEDYEAEQFSKSKSRNRRNWKLSLLASDPCCAYCHKELCDRDATLDHKVPLSSGGLDVRENVVLCCEPCNQIKSNRSPIEWGRDIMFGRVSTPDSSPSRLRELTEQDIANRVALMTDEEQAIVYQLVSLVTANRQTRSYQLICLAS